jgi:large subunit ribosomal protein L25
MCPSLCPGNRGLCARYVVPPQPFGAAFTKVSRVELKKKLLLNGGFMQVELEYFTRKETAHGANKRLLSKGLIPCVIYSQGKVGINGSVKKVEIEAMMRHLEQNFLPTTIFTLKIEDGKKVKAIVKDIQYKVTTYDVIHIDFLELVENHKVTVKVPIRFLKGNECPGVKAGGFLRPVMAHIRVRCLPKNIPSFFEVDCKDCNFGITKKVSDIQIPKNVECLEKQNDTIVTVCK